MTTGPVLFGVGMVDAALSGTLLWLGLCSGVLAAFTIVFLRASRVHEEQHDR